jgi:hypothetical protein
VKGVWAAAAEQVDRAPGAVARPQHGPQLVAVALGVQELPVAGALAGVGDRGPQGRRRDLGPGQVAVEVDVGDQELAAPHGRALLPVAIELQVVGQGGRGGQPGAGVGGQPHRGVERHQPAQAGRGGREHGDGAVDALDSQHELVTPPPDLGGHGHKHPAMVGQWRAGRNPPIGGLAPDRTSDTLVRVAAQRLHRRKQA